MTKHSQFDYQGKHWTGECQDCQYRFLRTSMIGPPKNYCQWGVAIKILGKAGLKGQRTHCLERHKVPPMDSAKDRVPTD